jgi:hypothetical protein
LTETLLRQGDYLEAAQHARTLVKFFPGQNRDIQRASAFLRRCSQAARTDQSLDPKLRDSRAQEFETEALHMEDDAQSGQRF